MGEVLEVPLPSLCSGHHPVTYRGRLQACQALPSYVADTHVRLGPSTLLTPKSSESWELGPEGPPEGSG